MSEILKLENVSYSVRSGKKNIQILDSINFKLDENSILGISGESGSGKTTLAKIIAGVLPITEGEITFSGKNTSNEKKRAVQILFQNNGEILNPLREIDNVIEEAIVIRGYEKNTHAEMEEIFNSINFPEHLWKRKGYELSGGEQQRAALARILAANPELLILDEPFSAQDPESQLNLLNLFLSINKKFNITMICIAHNLRILKKLCGKIIILYNGEIIEEGATEDIFNSPKHPYTKFLLKAENYDLSYEELRHAKRQL
jgi:ABC-type dipeptide/oligopeptide/nickel transport system ATPase subunit